MKTISRSSECRDCAIGDLFAMPNHLHTLHQVTNGQRTFQYWMEPMFVDVNSQIGREVYKISKHIRINYFINFAHYTYSENKYKQTRTYIV